MSKQRKVVTHNTVLGTTPDGEIYILADTFHYPDGFKGATGWIVRPVTQDELALAQTAQGKAEYYEDSWRQDAGTPTGTTLSLEDWADEIDDDEYIDSRFEQLDGFSTDEIAAALYAVTPALYEITGGGRIFTDEVLEWIDFIDTDEVTAARMALLQAEDR